MRLLIELIAPLAGEIVVPPGAEWINIAGITADSRQVRPGYLFVALRGTTADGTKFIPEAIGAGAVAVLCDNDAVIPSPAEEVAVICSANVRRALAVIAAAFYGRQPAHVVAVTGTDGKTSTADFYRQFWHYMDKSSASIGTLGVLSGTGEVLYPESRTTPDPVQLHKLLAEMTQKQITHAAMEASSHGLDQYRLDGVRLEAAAFTNLTRDHLDYHGTEEAYFAAKLRLFAELLPMGKTAVLNQDDPRFLQIKAICDNRRHAVIGFGRKGREFKVNRTSPLPHGQSVEVELFGEVHRLDIPLVGAFQAMNVLAALGLVIGSGGALEEALPVIGTFKGVPGRLEQVAKLHNAATVFIDYAHTPMALANILKTLRPHTAGRLHVVFGCGGDRDAGKRPEMGKAASELADAIVVTDDNPRSEDPAAIRSAVLAAAPGAKEIADRREAIYGALKSLAAGDILVVAGKGHEKTQIIGNKTFPFDDAEVVREAVKALKMA